MQETLESNQFTKENFFSLFPSFDGSNEAEIFSRVQQIRTKLREKALRYKQIEIERTQEMKSPWTNYGNGYTGFLKGILSEIHFKKFSRFVDSIRREFGYVYMIDIMAPEAFIDSTKSVEGICLTLKDFKNHTRNISRKLNTKPSSYVTQGDVTTTEPIIEIKSLLEEEQLIDYVNLIVCAGGGALQYQIPFKDIEFYFYIYFTALKKYLGLLTVGGVLISQVPAGICKYYEIGEDKDRRKDKFEELFNIYSDVFNLEEYFECVVGIEGIYFKKK